MNWNEKKESLKELNLTGYEGYIWASNEKKPKKTTDLSKFIEKQNPFILEGNFYKDNVSISIKHVARKYIINQYNLSDATIKDDFVPKDYLAHTNLGEKLCFKEIWIAEQDENCEKMEVMTKKAVAFVGFDKEVK